jgi:hypothetical protein
MSASRSLAPESSATGAGDRLRWAALPVVLAGAFMTILDFFIVNVAIPSIQTDLGATAAQIQLVVAGYGLAYAVGLITGGRLGDIGGRRRMFATGLAAFTVTSAACGLAPSAATLIAGRLAQGLSSALMFPQVLSILNVTFVGPARARAFTAFGMTLGLAAVSGQLLGGLLIAGDLLGLGWRTCIPRSPICSPPSTPARVPHRPQLEPARIQRRRQPGVRGVQRPARGSAQLGVVDLHTSRRAANAGRLDRGGASLARPLPGRGRALPERSELRIASRRHPGGKPGRAGMVAGSRRPPPHRRDETVLRTGRGSAMRHVVLNPATAPDQKVVVYLPAPEQPGCSGKVMPGVER